MSFLGNLCLAGAVLFLFGLLNYALFSKAPGGDAAVGRAFAIVLLFAGFFICMALVAVAVGQQGGFSWLGSSSGMRFLLGTGWFLLVMLGFYLYSDPGTGLPKFIRAAGMILLPLFLVTWGAVHLNDGLSRSLPAAAPKALTVFVFALGCLPLAANLLSSITGRVTAFSRRGELDSFEQGIVANIDTADVQHSIYNLLIHTPEGRHPTIREKALAKIKSRPDWQEEMIRLLKTEAAPEVLGFLMSNEVDNPTLFPEAINEGLLQQAQAIRAHIRNCWHQSHLNSGLEYNEVQTALLAIRRYQGMGVDYRPAVQAMKNAFDEPSDFDKPKFEAIGLIDRWLAKQAK